MEPRNPLSKREQDVVDRLLEGDSNKQIAAALGITERTVEFHLKNVYDKLQVRSRVELVLKLRSSTVAEADQLGVNQEQPNARGWANTLKAAAALIGKEIRMTSTVSNAQARPAGDNPSFFEAIRVCLSKYADFTGRAARPEFWWFALFVTLATAALSYFSSNLAAVFTIAMALPFLAAGARRLHDVGQSGWYQLYLLLPIAGVIMLVIEWAKSPVAATDEQPA